MASSHLQGWCQQQTSLTIYCTVTYRGYGSLSILLIPCIIKITPPLLGTLSHVHPLTLTCTLHWLGIQISLKQISPRNYFQWCRIRAFIGVLLTTMIISADYNKFCIRFFKHFPSSPQNHVVISISQQQNPALSLHLRSKEIHHEGMHRNGTLFCKISWPPSTYPTRGWRNLFLWFTTDFSYMRSTKTRSLTNMSSSDPR